MELKAPPGYGSVTPLDRETHKRVGLPRSASFTFATGLNAIYLTATEFVQAAHYYPIAFGKDDANGTYIPFAVTGLKSGQNLFVSSKGQWKQGAYIPAYVRRYPFCTFQLENKTDVLICVDEDGLKKGPPYLMNEEGQATEQWLHIESLINEMESARKLTDRFCKVMTDLNLLEPFEARIHPNDGEPMQLRGLYRINEAHLNKLSGKVIKDLMTRGELSRIYAHIMSLDNFARLLDMAATSAKQNRANNKK